MDEWRDKIWHKDYQAALKELGVQPDHSSGQFIPSLAAVGSIFHNTQDGQSYIFMGDNK